MAQSCSTSPGAPPDSDPIPSGSPAMGWSRSRLGIWMNGWEGLFLAVRRMGCFRAGCDLARSPPMPPSPGNAHTLATDIGEIRPGADLPRDRLRLLLKEFAALDDAREPWRVLYPLHEVLLLVTCATIASCDDFDDIVAGGTHHLPV